MDNEEPLALEEGTVADVGIEDQLRSPSTYQVGAVSNVATSRFAGVGSAMPSSRRFEKTVHSGRHDRR
jgi:hypothetical protein